MELGPIDDDFPNHGLIDDCLLPFDCELWSPDTDIDTETTQTRTRGYG